MHINFCHAHSSWSVVFCGSICGLAGSADHTVLDCSVSIFEGVQLPAEEFEVNQFPVRKRGLVFSDCVCEERNAFLALQTQHGKKFLHFVESLYFF